VVQVSRLSGARRGMNFQTGLMTEAWISFAKLYMPMKAFQRDLALVVVVAEADPQLVRDGPLLDPADEHVHVLFLDELGQFERVGVVDDDGPGSEMAASSL
jgi:hypothetical protein